MLGECAVELKGLVLHEKYRIYQVAGTAGMATFCLAREIATSGIVTVLVLEPPLTRDVNSVRRFLRSAELASGTGHPYIAPVIDYGEEGDICYRVMPFEPQGGTLAELERRSGVLSPVQAAWITSCVASALEAATGFGGIPFHGALVPAGIIVTPNGDAQVTGFGIAPASGAIDPALGEAAAAYAAPEQLDGRGVDVRSDLYTLCAILYEMLTGRVPPASEVRSFLTFGGSAQMERFLDKIPPQLRPVLSGLLQWDPDERFASPGDVLDALAKAGFPAPLRPVEESPGPGREHGPVLNALEMPEPAAGPVHMVGMEELYVQEKTGVAPGGVTAVPLTGSVGGAEIPPPEEGATWELAGPAHEDQPKDQPAVPPAVHEPRRRKWLVPVVAGMLVVAGVLAVAIARPFGHGSGGPGGTAVVPPVVQTTGTVSVTSVPAGARVLLDGKDTGKVTPVTLAGISAGSHGIVLNLAGYQEGRQTVSVSAGGTSTVKVTLSVQPETPSSSTSPTKPPTDSVPVQQATTIAVTSTPGGAAIVLDGKETGKTTPWTLTVPAGSHTVGVRLAGYAAATRTTTVASGKRSSVSFVLSKQVMGSLRIESTPTGASVTVDGTAVAGRTPVTISVALGGHAVRVTHAGYEAWSRTGVEVVKGIQTVIVARLVPLPVDLTFTSREAGFGFTYPSTWQVLEKPDSTNSLLVAEARSPAGPSVRVLVVPLNGTTLETYVKQLRSELEQVSNLVITAAGTRVVNGIAYQHLVTVRGGSQTEYCLLQSAGNVYRLECTAESSQLTSATAGFKTILGSFYTAP